MAGRPWWIDATVYQIYVRSFADSDGDGRGDLAGIIDRLDHLTDLGVDAIWMTPCYPSPQLDHGYDVADYFDIEPTYGTLQTFDRLVAACAAMACNCCPMLQHPLSYGLGDQCLRFTRSSLCR